MIEMKEDEGRGEVKTGNRYLGKQGQLLSEKAGTTCFRAFFFLSWIGKSSRGWAQKAVGKGGLQERHSTAQHAASSTAYMHAFKYVVTR